MGMLGLRPWGVAATALAVGLKLTIAGCIAAFNYFAWGWITDKFYVDLAKLYETWGIYYPYSGGRGGDAAPPHQRQRRMYFAKHGILCPKNC